MNDEGRADARPDAEEFRNAKVAHPSDKTRQARPPVTADTIPAHNESWSGCGGCDRAFASLRLFDAHFVRNPRRGSQYRAIVRCKTDEELVADGNRQDARGLWHLPGSRPLLPSKARTGTTGSDFQAADAELSGEAA